MSGACDNSEAMKAFTEPGSKARDMLLPVARAEVLSLRLMCLMGLCLSGATAEHHAPEVTAKVCLLA